MPDAASPSFVPQTRDNRPEPRTPFDFALNRFLDDLFEAEPVWATRIGYHAFDDRWPDPSESGRTARLAMLRHHRARLQALADAQLTPAEQIDRGITLEAIDAAEFNQAELREAAWDPLSYVYLCGTGFFSILARDFAPWEHRGAALLGRMRGLPRFLDSAAAALTGVPGRPVSLLHTETALAQLSGISDLVDQGIAEARRRADESKGNSDFAGLAAAMDAEGATAKQAVEEFARRLRDDIAPTPRAGGSWDQGYSRPSSGIRWPATFPIRIWSSARGTTTTSFEPRCCASRVRHGSTGCRERHCPMSKAWAPRRQPTTRRSARCSTPSHVSIASPPSCWIGAAPKSDASRISVASGT